MDGYPTIQEILDDFIQYIENNSPVSASELPNIDPLYGPGHHIYG